VAGLLCVLSCNEAIFEQEQDVLRDMEIACSVQREVKTALFDGDGSIWLAGDCISIFDGSSNCKFTTSITGANVTFTGKAGAAETYYALYPYNEQASCSSGVFKTSVPNIQYARKDSFADETMVLATSFTGYSAVFHNQLAAFKLTIPSGVSSIRISGYNHISLTGECVIDLNKKTCSAGTNSYSDVLLISENGGELEAGTYYIGVIPSVISAGFSITLTGTGTKVGHQIVKSTAKYLELKGNKIYDLGTIAANWTATPGAGVTANIHKGLNLEGCFEVGYGSDASNIWMGYFNDTHFGYFEQIGVDVVRVPMQLGYFLSSQAPNYTLQQAFFDRLDEALALARKHNMSLIIDNHVWGVYDQSGYQYPCMKKIWEQIATHCKNMGQEVIYELFNEPDGTYWHNNWHTVQGNLIQDIRAIDQNHTIIITPTNYCSIADLPTTGGYKDTNLLYSFHCYFPYEFTHQGATFSHVASLGGKLHFPYQSGDEQWYYLVTTSQEVQDDVRNYANRGTVSALHAAFAEELNACRQRGAKLFVGEFGTAWSYGMDKQSRLNWLRNVSSYMDVNDIAWTHWDYAHDFGIINTTDPVNFTVPNDVNKDVITALGFNGKKIIPVSGQVSDFSTEVFVW